MKTLLIVISLIMSHLLFSQESNVFNPLTNLNENSNTKIILVTASWCQVCKKTKKILISEKLSSLTNSSKIMFFEFNNKTEETVLLNNRKFNYIPTGLKSGRHEFLSFLDKDNEVVFPSVYILNPNNEVVQKYNGFLSEDDWTILLTSLAN